MLDVSAPNASPSRELRKRGIDVVESTLRQILAAPAHANAASPGQETSTPAATEEPRRYSAIVAMHVLERVRDPKSVLRSMRQLLADDGCLVLLVPNADAWGALLLADRWGGFDVPRHRLMFRLETLQSALEDSGFKVLRHKYFSLYSDPVELATSIAPSLDPALRRMRGVRESKYLAVAKDALYAILMLVAAPLALLEGTSGSGATLMVEARKADDASAAA